MRERLGPARWLAAAVALLAAAPCWAGKELAEPARAVVGTSVAIEVVAEPSTPAPGGGPAAWTRTVTVEGATFLKPHFVDLNLAPGDTLRVRSASGRIVEEVAARGPKQRGSFWGLSVPGSQLLLELITAYSYARPAFRIDQVLAGREDLFAPTPEPTRTVCPPADFEDVICYQSDPVKWANVLASVGVMTVGGTPASALFCSGANVSPRGYVLTNQHCIPEQVDCDNSEFVFRYYRTACGGGAPTEDWQSFRCDEIAVQSPFVSCESGPNDLDFTLASVIGDPTATFGSVVPDPTPLADGEAIYIVQHPSGRPHEITHGSGSDVDVDGTVLRYFGTLDTEGGSSGSPIFRDGDDKMVGLHHCGDCENTTGNRGMLMSDLYPHLEPFLCSAATAVVGAGVVDLAEVEGNGNPRIDPGETWSFRPLVRNVTCEGTALDVTGRAQASGGASPVLVLADDLSFGSVPAGQVAAAVTPVTFQVSVFADCGAPFFFDLVGLTATGAGPLPPALRVLEQTVGELPRTTLLMEDFAAGIPAAWTVVDGGTGSGPAATWTTANPGGRLVSFTPPFAIVDSDELGIGLFMDEELISPTVDATGFSAVELQFGHDFNWYELGLDERGDVDVRSAATAGAWVNVKRFSGDDSNGTERLDISSLAAGQADLQVRFHYHNARFEWWWVVDDIFVLGDNGWVCSAFVPTNLLFADGFETGDTSAWTSVFPPP